MSLNSLTRGLDTLEIVAEHGPIGLGDLSLELDTSRATAARTIAVLRDRGYLSHDTESRSYSLGPALDRLVDRGQHRELLKLVEPALNRLSQSIKETCNFAHYSGGRAVYAVVIEGSEAMRMRSTVGTPIPMHATSIGKAILAALPERRRRAAAGAEPYQAFTDRTLRSWNDLSKDLHSVSSRGWAIDREENDEFVTCIAAAVTRSNGAPIGAISVSGLRFRMPPGSWPKFGALVRSTAQSISQQLSEHTGVVGSPN